jgi:hypothetical protein
MQAPGVVTQLRKALCDMTLATVAPKSDGTRSQTEADTLGVVHTWLAKQARAQTANLSHHSTRQDEHMCSDPLRTHMLPLVGAIWS